MMIGFGIVAALLGAGVTYLLTTRRTEKSGFREALNERMDAMTAAGLLRRIFNFKSCRLPGEIPHDS